MYINCHTHVFTTNDVFTNKSIDILFQRLFEEKHPGQAIDMLRQAWKHQGKTIDESEDMDGHLAIKKLATSSYTFRELLREAETESSKDFGIPWNAAPTDLRDALDGFNFNDLLDNYFPPDHAKSTPRDWVRMIRSWVQSIDYNTDVVVRADGSDAGAVLLMMDISDGGRKGEKQYNQHIQRTSRQVQRHPGRVFPFIAVHPNRTGFATFAKRALKTKGFVGVKLYPSLGYQIDENLAPVFDLCQQDEVPIMVHCSPGGFRPDQATALNANPENWRPVLASRNKIKVCFGHFGGARDLAGLWRPEDDVALNLRGWSGKIMQLMREFPGQVYADIAYHDLPMDSEDNLNAYFERLKEVITDPDTGPFILWGSDYHMCAVRLSEKSYWSFFRKRLAEDGAQFFEKIARDNPRRFLGWRDDNSLCANLDAYVAFIRKERTEDRLAGTPAPWLDSFL